LDVGGAYKSATDGGAPHVIQCEDPFHLVKLANDAVGKAARRWAWNEEHWLRPPSPRRTGKVTGTGCNELVFVKHAGGQRGTVAACSSPVVVTTTGTFACQVAGSARVVLEP
jgi:hypothetical protein